MKILCSVILLVTVMSANGQFDPNQWNNRSVMVHLFELKYRDIAEECETFLAPNNFSGVQTSVTLENKIISGTNVISQFRINSMPLESEFILTLS